MGIAKGWPLPSPSGGGADAVLFCAPGTLNVLLRSVGTNAESEEKEMQKSMDSAAVVSLYPRLCCMKMNFGMSSLMRYDELGMAPLFELRPVRVHLCWITRANVTDELIQ